MVITYLIARLSSMKGGKTDEKRVKELAETLQQKMEGYERILSKQKYLAGNVSLFRVSLASSILRPWEGNHTGRFIPSPVRYYDHGATWRRRSYFKAERSKV